jgi:hypothetical protein
MRPIIRPGLHVLRRDLRTLQLGVEWPGVAALPDGPVVRAVLDAVDGFRDLPGVLLAVAASGVPAESARQAIDALLDAGVLVDQAVVRPEAVDEARWATMWLMSGPSSTAADLQASRERTRVHVAGAGRVADRVRELVRAEGLPLDASSDSASVVVLASDTEPARGAADEALRIGVPFLCVGLRELVGLVGPFVVPGRTCCLRCVDLARAHLDPCWPMVVESLHDPTLARPSGSPSLIALTAACAAQDVIVWASGGVPNTCDHVVEIPHGLGPVETVAYQPHPQCGCGWRAGRETMSA